MTSPLLTTFLGAWSTIVFPLWSVEIKRIVIVLVLGSGAAGTGNATKNVHNSAATIVRLTGADFTPAAAGLV